LSIKLITIIKGLNLILSEINTSSNLPSSFNLDGVLNFVLKRTLIVLTH